MAVNLVHLVLDTRRKVLSFFFFFFAIMEAGRKELSFILI